MSARGPVAPRHRLRLAGQVALGVALLAIVVTLAVDAFAATAARQREYDLRLETESSAANAFFAQRESLNLAVKAQAYLGGAVTRREVQIARALLTQRLRVRADDGRSAGDAFGAAYRDRLLALDSVLARVPSGLLAADQEAPVRAMVTPALDAFTSQARQLAATYEQEADRRAREALAARLESDQRQVVLFAAALALALILLGWIALSLRRDLRSARRRLDDDERELASARAALQRASELERGQARVLERIATGAPLRSVFQCIVDLACDLTGLTFALQWDSREVEALPAGAGDADEADIRVLWSAPIGIDRDGAAEGVLVALDHSGRSLDEAARRIALRCADLAAIALDRDHDARALTFQAHHDPLTGLANRSRLLEMLDEALAATRRDPAVEDVVLLFCDLDRFKVVNDSLGHDVGDTLLEHVAVRLRSCVRGNDVVARLGGDEFVVMLRDPASRDTATTLAERITVLLRHPFSIAGQEVFVGVSIGIARSTPHDDPASLLRHADLAMYRSKVDGRDRVTVYDAQMETATLAALDLDTALRRAVERGELALTLQPIVGLPGREVVGVEALVRWRRPLYGLLPPASFIPAAEDTGLVVEIGRWVLLESVTWLAGWHRRHPGSTLTAAVNVSGRQLRESGFADEVLDIIAGQGLRPELLTLELTESTLVDDADADAVLDRLRRAGVRIALDDFGTGYSSLTRLRNLPVDVLKLDRTFVAPLVGDDPAQRALVDAVVRLGEAMGLDLVVEGIETEAECAAIVGLGGTLGQGFLFGTPMAPDVASHWLEDQPARDPVGLV